MLLTRLEERDNTLSSTELARALERLGKTYVDVGKGLGITGDAVWQWVNVAHNIPEKRRKSVLELLVKWKEQAGYDGELLAAKNENGQVVADEPSEAGQEQVSDFRTRREKLGISQRVVGEAVGLSGGSYYYREANPDKATKEEREAIEKTLAAFERVVAGKHLLDSPLAKSDVKDALRMLRLHIKWMDGSLIKEMALKYVDVIEAYLDQ